MSTSTRPTTSAPSTPSPPGTIPSAPIGSSPTVRRVVGWLMLAHVLLVFVGIALMQPGLIQDGVDDITRAYGHEVARPVAGGVLELLAFVILLPTMVYLSGILGTRTEVGRLAAQTGVLAGVGYVALSFAPGFSGAATAMHLVQSGLDVETAYALNSLRVYSYIVSLMLLGAHALCLAVAAWQDHTHTRWVGWGGLVTGLALVASVPLGAVHLHDYGTLVWLVWWVGLAVLLLRGRSVVGPQ